MRNNELGVYTYEKEELGCVGKQIFTCLHSCKDINVKNVKHQKFFLFLNHLIFFFHLK